MIYTDRLGVRIGDIFADTQVVDGKVLAKGEAVTPDLAATPAPPGPRRARRAAATGRRRRARASPAWRSRPHMRIALTHNLRLSDSEEEAEFDTGRPSTPSPRAIERLGHRVERIEVSGPGLAHRRAPRGLRAGPHLQHRRGPARPLPRGVLPGALRGARHPVHRLRRLRARGHPRQAAHQARLAQHGVATPRWQFVEDARQLAAERAALPGDRQAELRGQLEGHHAGLGRRGRAARCTRSCATRSRAIRPGVLVEEFIVGRDMTVPFLEAAAPEPTACCSRSSTSSTSRRARRAATPSTTTS